MFHCSPATPDSKADSTEADKGRLIQTKTGSNPLTFKNLMSVVEGVFTGVRLLGLFCYDR